MTSICFESELTPQAGCLMVWLMNTTTSANEIRKPEFFTGGNALFTVSNPSGVHYTYKIRRPKADAPFFASLVSGMGSRLSPGGQFRYLGIFQPETKDVVLTKRSTFTNSDQPVQVLRWALKRIATGQNLPEGYHVQHEGRCCVCGRTLTTPESINLGIGPECARRQNSQN